MGLASKRPAWVRTAEASSSTTELRTSARGVYAIGDCRDGPRLTHAAGYEGARIVAAIGFGLRARVDYRALPRVAYTSPELAQVGMTEEAEAREGGGRVTAMREPFADNDRAVAEGASVGFLKVVRRNGRIVGACLVGERVGDLTMPWVLSIGGAKPTPWALSGMILPYPTRSEITKAAAFAMYAPRLFSRRRAYGPGSSQRFGAGWLRRSRWLPLLLLPAPHARRSVTVGLRGSRQASSGIVPGR